jgi:hypothetical protein
MSTQMIAAQKYLAARRQPQLRIQYQWILFAILIIGFFFIRFNVFPYGFKFNTVFFDEAVNVIVGENALAGDYSRNAIAWTFGSYLFPYTAGLAEMSGGYEGLRLWIALLNCAMLGCVAATTWRLFGGTAALWALCWIGFMGASINMGQLAVYDSTGMPLMAGALMAIVYGCYASGWRQRGWFVAAGCLAAFSVLSKYIGIAFVLPLFLSGFILLLSFRRSWSSVLALFYALIPFVCILLSYGLANRDALITVFSNRNTLLFAQGTPEGILSIVMEEIGILTGLALLGVAAAIVRQRQQRHVKGLRGWFVVLLVFTFVASLYIVPLYQLLTLNVQSLWKHTLYAAMFMTPLAAYGCVRLFVWLQSREALRLLATIAFAGIMVWHISSGLDRNWEFQNGWPNATAPVSFLQTQSITPETRILAEQSWVYDYYVGLGPYTSSDIWLDTFQLAGMDDTQLEAELRARQFDYVIFDDFYTAALNARIEARLREMSYVLVYTDNRPQAYLRPHFRIYKYVEAGA